MIRNILLTIAVLLAGITAKAQKFFNLTADEVRIDSVIPTFGYSKDLGPAYADSIYTVTIEYPEFINMQKGDVEKLKKISNVTYPALPEITTKTVVERKKGRLEVYFSPIVMRNGKYQKLVSFMLRITAKPKSTSTRKANAKADKTKSERWAKNSVLATGNWAKIRVPSTGVYQITDALIRQAGFNDLSKVKVYGYGGALHSEQLLDKKIAEYDDLKEVPTVTVNGKKLFRAIGPVSWESATKTSRIRNPYSDYGYYFITQSEGEPLSVDSAAFVSSFYPANDDYHTLYEVDDYAWFQGGRNLFDNTPINPGASLTYELTTPAQKTGEGTLFVRLTSSAASTSEIAINDSVVGTITTKNGGEYDTGVLAEGSFYLKDMLASSSAKTNKVKITNKSSNTVRLDYITLTFNDPRPEPQLSKATFATPEYVYNITNQNLHGDKNYDMVMIIPASQKLLKQAERLKAYHEEHDKMSVRIVPADELYNEFSSGTPEADAYRLYMKMMYDRAEDEASMPKYLLLFGDCKWDNRMKVSALRNYSPDDFLLCFESDNSFSYVNSFIDDCYFTALDDGEGANASAYSTKSDKYDIAVGRFPVKTADEAKIMVDKSISYMENKMAGAWQNVALFLGDDGNNNAHVTSVDNTAKAVEQLVPAIQAKRVFWDMYTRVSSATGNTYPEVTSLLKKQQAEGALLFDYAGHGRPDMLSHELVLSSADFAAFKNKVLPLWITASCDIMPYDGTVSNIGVNSVLNPNGGTFAFYGTARTVYITQNQYLNAEYVKALFTKTNGKFNSVGEAQRVAKNRIISDGTDRTVNKLHYALLGDPAISLKIAESNVVIDSINGICLAEATELPQIKAGAKVNVKGHIKNADGTTDDSFTGTVNIDVKDSKEKRVGKLNSKDTGYAYTFFDYTKTIFNGNDSISSGKFDITFAVTKDINYTDENGRINAFAVSSTDNRTMNGYTENFIVGGTEIVSNDSNGPSIYCYLNSPSFSNGGNVNSTPYFVAEISDKDGLNTSGSGIGHDLTLVVDDDPMMTFTLNDNFSFNFGSYTEGTTWCNIPELENGPHKLKFTAWDILNNPSTTTLKFNVVKGLTPNITNVYCSNNPAKTNTTFIVSHDRSGSNVEMTIEVFDISGRLLWNHTENTQAESATFTYDWDLTTDSGGRLQSGVYLYRVRLTREGKNEATKAKKLIVLN